MNAVSVVLGAIVLFLFAVGTLSFVVMAKGCLVLRRMARSTPRFDGNILLKSPLVPKVSVVVAVPDISRKSRALVRRLIELHFSKHEVVLVLDGPDHTELADWTKEFRLSPSARGSTDELPAASIRGVYESADPLQLVVVDKERGGFADAMNAGVNVASSAVIGLVDAACRFEPTILLNLIRPMLEDPERTIAVLGVMPPPVAPGLAGQFGTLESLRLWLTRCAAFADWNMLVPVPGVWMLAMRDAIVGTGGFRAGPLQLFLNLHGNARASGKPYRIALVPEGVSHAAAPDSFADLRREILREEREIAGAFRRRKSIAGGMRAINWGLPGIFCVRWLRPFLETAAYLLAAAGWAMGWVSPRVGRLGPAIHRRDGDRGLHGRRGFEGNRGIAGVRSRSPRRTVLCHDSGKSGIPATA